MVLKIYFKKTHPCIQKDWNFSVSFEFFKKNYFYIQNVLWHFCSLTFKLSFMEIKFYNNCFFFVISKCNFPLLQMWISFSFFVVFPIHWFSCSNSNQMCLLLYFWNINLICTMFMNIFSFTGMRTEIFALNPSHSSLNLKD